MKRFLSTLLCAVLLLGLLPVVSPPAYMITTAQCSVNKTTAFVGDTITWAVSGEDGTGPYAYSFNVYRNGSSYLFDGNWQYDVPTRDYVPPEPGTFYPEVWVWEYTLGQPDDGYAIDFSGPETTVSLRPAPAIVKVESLSAASIKVTWSKVAGATGYFVERSTSKTTGFKVVKTTTALSFTNTYLKAGTRYYYRVRSYNLCDGQTGKENWPSSGFSAAKAGVPLAKPTITGAVGVSSSQIKLNWTKVSGATGYQVFKSATSGGAYTAIKATTALSYTAGGMLHAKTYYFKVRPYKKILTAVYYGPLSGYKAGRTK